jgi:hypothetical protein
MNRADRFNAKSSSTSSKLADKPAEPAMAFCGIAFMAKASVPGRAKTRLVPPLSFDEAAKLNTAFLRDVADNLSLAARHATPGQASPATRPMGHPVPKTFSAVRCRDRSD